jgi:hypothetical protein
MKLSKNIRLWCLVAGVSFAAAGCESMTRSAFGTADLNQRTRDYESRGQSSDRARGNAMHDQLWEQGQ